MDPQKLSKLDPKLREVYERVMGTPIPQVENLQSPPPPPATPPPTPPAQPSAFAPEPPISESKPLQPEPSTQPIIIPDPNPIPVASPEPSIPPQPAFEQLNSQVSTSPNFSVPQTQTQNSPMPVKKKNSLMVFSIVIASVIFFVVYALFWTKVFNLKLPFLP